MTRKDRQSDTDAERLGQPQRASRWRTAHTADHSGTVKHEHKQPYRLVSRLIGLETEYATLVMGSEGLEPTELPAAQRVYTALCNAIRQEQPTVPGVFDHDQLFLANGSAVSFESHPTMHQQPGGFLEIATPEVHAPTDLLACQRAIDTLATDAANNSSTGFDIRMIKNKTAR